MNYRGYHFVFETHSCPPVALDAPAKMLGMFCASFTVSVVGVCGEGEALIIL